MMRQGDGHPTSCNLLDTVAGAVILDICAHRDARLIPADVLRTFQGPARGISHPTASLCGAT